MSFSFRPRLFDVLRAGYTRQQLGRDVAAGVVVGLIAVPLAIGFGVASIPFVPPAGLPSPAAMGLYSAILGGFLISLLGGSRVQIGGPTGAFIPIVAVIAERHGLAGLWLATFLAGLMLIALGFARAGGFSRFVPLPVVIGFTSGIAVLIGIQQIKDLGGLRLAHALPAEGWEKIAGIVRALPNYDPTTLLVSVIGLIAIFALPERWRPRILVLVLGTLAVNLLGLAAAPGKAGLATIGSTFGHADGASFSGAIPAGLPQLIPLHWSWEILEQVFPSALVIAFLGAIESILSALSTDKIIKDHHDSDQELIAQGVANCLIPWCGGLPVTGAIARSSTNVQSGGRTPVAGLVHALFLAVVLLAGGPLVERIPICVLAVILMHVAVKMFETRGFAEIGRVTRAEMAVAVITFLLTALIDLNWGVGFGLGVSAVASIMRLKEITVIRPVRIEMDGDGNPLPAIVFRIEGMLFYAVADEFLEKVERALELDPSARALILRIQKMVSLDFQGLKAMHDLHELCQARGVQLILCDTQPHPMRMMHKDGLVDRLGLENLCGDFEDAMKRAREVPAPA